MPVSLRAFFVCWQPLYPTPSEIKLQSAISAAVVQPLSAEGLMWKRNGFSKIQLRVCNLSILSFHSTSTVLYLNDVYYSSYVRGKSNSPPVDRFSWSQYYHLPSVWYYRMNRHNLLIKQNWLKLKEPVPAPWEFESCRISVNKFCRQLGNVTGFCSKDKLLCKRKEVTMSIDFLCDGNSFSHN